MLFNQSGTTSNGLDWLCTGNGNEILVYFPGINDALQGVHDNPVIQSLIVAPLLRHRRVYLVGRRRNIPAGYRLRDFGRDYIGAIEEIISHENIHARRVDIAGVSMGGLCALQVAADRPRLVRRLGIHSAAHRIDPGFLARAEYWGRLAREKRWRKLYRALNRDTFDRQTRMILDLLITLAPWLARRPRFPQDFTYSLQACRDVDLGPRLHSIQAPAQLITGDRDPVFPWQLAQECAHRMPQCELTLIPGGHGIIIEQQAEFERAFSAFMQQPA